MLIVNIKELRIGNYVDYPLIGIGSIETGKDIDDAYEFGCIPVPLNHEWLEKFGFIDPAKNGWAYRIDLSTTYELCWYMQDGFLRYQTKGSGFTRQLNHIKYVHQLQNLYFALTGEELTIKEPA